MIINHNMNAINAHRLMSGNTANAGKSMEKLSSGLRINRAGDDAAGLAISEKMRAQIRGLDQASRNSQDGISMVQTAEGALNETQSILQRMRELATQSANDTNVAVDRNEIQKEMNQLTSEINRIGNTTEFNTQKILRGDGSAVKEVGALDLDKTGGITQASLTGGEIEAAKIASLQVSLAASKGADDLKGEEFTFKFNGTSIKLNFETVTNASDEKANTFEVKDGGNEVTVTLVDGATNQDFIMSKVKEALESAMTANTNINAADYTISRDKAVLSINSVTAGEGQSISVIGAATNDALTGSVDNGGTFNAVVAAEQEATGTAEVRTRATATIASLTVANLEAEVIKSGISTSNTDYFDTNKLTENGAIKFLTGKGLTIGDETIEFFNSNEAKYEGKADFAVDLALVEWDATKGPTEELEAADLVKLVAGIVEQIGNKMENVTLAVNGGAAGSLDVTAKDPGAAGNSIEINDGATRAATDVVGSTFKATFQIGANQGQSFQMNITDMRSQALGVSGVKDGAAHGTVEGAKFTATKSVTNGTDSENSEVALDVSSHETATAAIKVINNAIEKVSAQRSELGAYQNRLEHTINNLGTASENLTSAESRIRDVDMAKEMMTFSKNNILSQAAQAMLAQANQQPQGVLQLLR